ncbi:1-acyl-sn-glycerol-3-phosphate acyltransferase [Chitinivibrio alkaliphilus]|uniref:Glycerol-3-phosphate acyltransferase n=1 Tax=Chitinivibrio alkaliphilus ACht1 TaxID=1313304 RepID=U7D7B4_9BACT|nr:1-acyl-sn-glycerol-3-phosphate acyltransferase [Chitinivibrio alkaliphilus]ERP38830.1 hypothetical protein CALK_0602 [Chitinivibrio alkaliphilus ACht1]
MSKPSGRSSREYTSRLYSEMAGIEKYVTRVFSKVAFPKEDIDRLFSVDNERVTIVCTHRSHADYLVTGLEFIREGVQNLRFAAGDNLTGLPFIGILFRKVGSFTVQRGRVHNRQYLFRLAEFVKRLLQRGQNVLVYPEGGRSYSGRMLEIKSGLIGSTIMAQKENPERDYYILPMACSYSAVPEAQYFHILLRGKEWRTKKGFFMKSLGSLLYYGADVWTFLQLWLFPPKKNEIYIDVGTPVRVKDITDVEGLYRKNAKNEFFANGRATKECSVFIRKRLLQLYRVLPHNIVAYLMDTKLYYQGESASIEKIEEIISFLSTNECNTKGLDHLSPQEILLQGGETLRSMKVCRERGKKGVVVRKKDLLRYYANTVYDVMGE